MATGLNFLHYFFMKKKCELEKVTIVLEERPCYDIQSEDYRFRVKIAETIDEIDIRHKDVAIEDHHRQIKHQKPHLQFKLYADGVGPIHIFLPVNTADDYKKYILSFLDIIGGVLIKMDNHQKDIQNNFMIGDNFKEIEGMGDNIKKLIYEQYLKGELTISTLEKEERKISEEDIKKIRKIPQISPFFESL